MATTTDNGFGQELRRLRKAAGYGSTELLASKVREEGTSISGTALGQWERGDHAPSPANLAAVEGVLGSDGRLAQMLGIAAPGTARDVSSRLDSHEERIARLEARLDAIAGATKPGEEDGERHLYPAAAEKGGDDHLAPPPTGDYHRPQPPPIEPELDEPGPEFGA